MEETNVHKKFDVLIIGGGFAGIYCARTVQAKFKKKNLRIGLISEENYMVFQPMLPEVVGGSLAPRHVINPIRLLCRHTEVYRGQVQSIDPINKTLNIDAGPFTNDFVFGFDKLVLALGSITDLSRIPGMAEHAYLLRNTGDAMKLRATIISRLEEANMEDRKTRRQELLRFVIVGGGYSGVETAGQIIDLLHSITRYYKNVEADDYHVSLVHSRDHLLNTLHEKLGCYVEDKLRQRGVHLWLNARVKSVTAHRVTLNNGEILEATTVVSTVGSAPNPLTTQLIEDLKLESKWGKIVAQPNFKVEGADWLWTAGDCAAVPMINDEFAPPNAQFALRQGLRLGKNILAEYDKKPLKPFDFTGLGELATVGHRQAVATIKGLKFSGFFAWFMWRTIYLSKLPGLERKLRVAAEWTVELFFPRDITLLTPQYSSPLQATYINKGEYLFHSGEPAFSFYMIKSGFINIVDDEGEVIRALGPGQHFGERALMEDHIWRFHAVAKEDAILVSLGSKVFDTLTYASGAIGKLLQSSATTYQSEESIDQLTANIPPAIRGRKASELMRHSVTALRETMTIREALALMQQYRHSTYPVLTLEGKILGAIKRSDMLEWIKTHAIQETSRVTEVPYAASLIIPPYLESEEVLEKLIRESATKAFIADRDQILQGIITIVDLVNFNRQL